MYRSRQVALTAMSIAASLLIASTAAAASTNGRVHQDYLASVDSNGLTAAVAGGADPCTQPPNARTGAWVCYTDSPGTVAAAQTLSPRGASSVLPSSAVGICNISGCYNRYDDFHVDFQSSSGTWGYQGTVLGTVYIYVNWQLVGAQTTSKPVQWRTSRTTNTIVFTGDLLNAAKGATGTEVPGTFGLYPFSAATAGILYAWNPNGYRSYDNTMWDHSQVQQFSWSLAGYQGYWYTYVKSISAHTNVLGNSAIYRFRSDLGLPASPYGGGVARLT